MKIKRILVSQPAPPANDKSPFVEIAQKHNVTIDFNPFIRIEGATVREFRAQRVDLLAHTAIIFTSRTSIDHFFRICEEARITMPETMKYFCITEAIALYLQKYIVYRKRKIFFGQGSLPELAELIVKHGTEKFVLPFPEPHKPEIPKALDKLKIKYSKLIIAHTVSADIEGIDIDKYDILVFYSPAEIAALIAHKNITGSKPMIATFGNGTAVAAVDAGLKVRVLAPTPEFPSMTKAIDMFIKRYNANEQIADLTVEKHDHVASIVKIAQTKVPKKAKIIPPKPVNLSIKPVTSSTKTKPSGIKPTSLRTKSGASDKPAAPKKTPKTPKTPTPVPK